MFYGAPWLMWMGFWISVGMAIGMGMIVGVVFVLGGIMTHRKQAKDFEQETGL